VTKAKNHIADLALDAMTLPVATTHEVPRDELANFIDAMNLEDRDIIPGAHYTQMRPVFTGTQTLGVEDNSPAADAVRASPFVINQDLAMIGDVKIFSTKDLQLGLATAEGEHEGVLNILVVCITRCKPEVAIFNPVTDRFSRSAFRLPSRLH
jgi:hypothetical protein